MFSIGWSEIFIIVAVTVLVIGPQDIPKVMVTLGRLTRRLHYVRFALTRQFDDFMRANGLDDVDDLRRHVNFEDKAPADATFDEAAADEDDDNDIIDLKAEKSGSGP